MCVTDKKCIEKEIRDLMNGMYEYYCELKIEKGGSTRIIC